MSPIAILLSIIAMKDVDMKFMRVGFVPPHADWMAKSHHHQDFNELIIPIHGRLHLAYDDARVIAGANDVLLYPKHCWHEEKADPNDPVELVFLSFSGEMDAAIRIFHDHSGKIRLLAQWLFKARKNSLLCESYFSAIMEEIQLLAVGNISEDIATRARSTMSAHISDPITLDQLADATGMSKFHFIRTYKKLTGVTPLHDYRRLRAEEAANLLATTYIPIKAIGPMTGFANEYHFSRVFKTFYGIPPATFRRQKQ